MFILYKEGSEPMKQGKNEYYSFLALVICTVAME